MLQKTTRTLSETLKKFFEPVKHAYRSYFLIAFMAIYQSVIMVFFANLIKGITNFIANKDIHSIYRFGIIYGILILVFQILQWFLRSEDRMANHKASVFLRTKYFKKLIQMDNNLYETMGVGKLMSIGFNGVDTWFVMLYDIFTSGMQRLIITILGLISVALIGWQYLFLVLAFILTSGILFLFLRKPIQSCRNERRELWGEMGRQDSKIVMSKFEILQQGRADQETHKFQKILEKELSASTQQDRVQYPLDRGPKVLIDLFRISVVFFVGVGAIYGKYSIGDFAAFMILLTLIDSSVVELLRMCMRMFDQSLKIEKLWETFDDSL